MKDILSLSDVYFGTGENYWKGPIWININYLILASLHNNYLNEGFYKYEALDIYTKLKTNIVNNIIRVRVLIQTLKS
jgi:mannosyl-oligosaccharide glucosidase